MNRCVLALALVIGAPAIHAEPESDDDDAAPADPHADDDDDVAPPPPAQESNDDLELDAFWQRVDALYARCELLLAPWSGTHDE